MVFTTLAYSRYPFADSTLLDNYSAAYIVNNKALLEPRSFIKCSNSSIDSRTSSLPISGRGQRIIQGVLQGPAGDNTVDLILNKVAIVEGFHVNIISKAKLRKASL